MVLLVTSYIGQAKRGCRNENNTALSPVWQVDTVETCPSVTCWERNLLVAQ